MKNCSFILFYLIKLMHLKINLKLIENHSMNKLQYLYYINTALKYLKLFTKKKEYKI